MLARAMDILCDEGLGTLANRTIDRFIYASHAYYITKYDLANIDYDNHIPKADPKLYRAQLISCRHSFISKYDHIPSLLDYDKRLKYGCIAMLVFYQNQLATIGWSCPTFESSKADRLWHEVAKHYANYPEITVGGGQWTNPKFRNLGFGTYGVLQRAKYNYSTGKKVIYGTCEIANKSALAMQLKAGAEIVGKVRITSTLFGMRWEELR